ncbi:copper amine oxidase N-terminal domain-containing protein [Paenibacillus sp. MBLB4367]|uniref:copper amine oxidase N-terminal domain-containing protein n=1 Tax=Paenibacillus sp. MBLB4367 TaxID=3384767 RepID=UPI0039084581
MKKTALTTTLALTISLMGAQAFAQYDPTGNGNATIKDENGNAIAQTLSLPLDTPMPISAGLPEITADSDAFGKWALQVNGAAVQDAGLYKHDGQTPMIPLRAVAEALGYELSWNNETMAAELRKGNQWTSVSIGQDRYSFAKMLITLGTAPELKDNKTYVPLQFAADVLKANVTVTEGTLSISRTDQKPQDSFGGMHWVLVVNGKGLGEPRPYEDGEHVMIPLKPVAEALGYTYGWNEETQTAELSKGAQWTSVKVGEDRYSFAKMLITLGKAPSLKDGSLFVPMSFLDEVLKLKYGVDPTGVVSISNEPKQDEQAAGETNK